MASIDVMSPQTQSRGSSRVSSREPSRGASRTGSSISGQSNRSSSVFFRPFGFDSQTSYDALGDLLHTRSDAFVIKVPEKEDDIWKRPPPDFRPQCYEPKPPARNSRDAMKPWKYGTIPGERTKATRHSAPARLPNILQPKPEEQQHFVTTNFDIHDSWRAKLICAREGYFKPGQYKMPKPHDFRGYPPIASLGLSEFVVDEEHDPFNLRFKSDRLDVLPGDGPATREEREIVGRQMAPPLSAKLHWDRKLILDSLPFPNRLPAYTRHRRKDRSVHSALMEKVEERLQANWARNELDKTLQKHREIRNLPSCPGDDIEDSLVADESASCELNKDASVEHKEKEC